MAFFGITLNFSLKILKSKHLVCLRSKTESLVPSNDLVTLHSPCCKLNGFMRKLCYALQMFTGSYRGSQGKLIVSMENTNNTCEGNKKTL